MVYLLKNNMEKEIIKLYTEEKETLRFIADKFNTNHHKIKRILLKNWIEINTKDRKKRILTEEHKAKIKRVWQNNKWKISKLKWRKTSEEIRRKNMIWHFKRNLNLNDFNKYDNLEKLLFLNKVISRHRKHFNDDEKYLAYLDKFFYNDLFNKLYIQWIYSWRCKWKMPSLEHILPISRWWTFDLDNLTFTTWFENRAKAEMTLEEWNSFKKQTWTQSNLFYL